MTGTGNSVKLTCGGVSCTVTGFDDPFNIVREVLDRMEGRAT